jgi:hypothetical protein
VADLVRPSSISGIWYSSGSGACRCCFPFWPAMVVWRRASYRVLELCPRGNNKDVIIIILVHDNVYILC